MTEVCSVTPDSIVRVREQNGEQQIRIGAGREELEREKKKKSKVSGK